MCVDLFVENDNGLGWSPQSW